MSAKMKVSDVRNGISAVISCRGVKNEDYAVFQTQAVSIEQIEVSPSPHFFTFTA